jgi:hypothetical protein
LAGLGIYGALAKGQQVTKSDKTDRQGRRQRLAETLSKDPEKKAAAAAIIQRAHEKNPDRRRQG